MKQVLSFVLLLVLTIVVPFIGEAQSEPSPRLYAVLETHVKPGWVPVYESSFGDLMELSEEESIPWRFGPIVSLNESCSYFHLFPPIGDLNELARLQNAENPKGIEAWDKLIEKIQVSKLYENWWVVKERPDLSYHPNGDRLTFGGDSQYLSCTFFYGMAAQKNEIEGVCREWIELYQTNEIPYGYSVFECMVGGARPLWIFVYAAPDAPTFFQRQKEIAQKLGYQEAKMMEKALKQCRSYQVRSGFYRPELTGWKKWGTE